MTSELKKERKPKINAFRLVALAMMVAVGAWNSECQAPEKKAIATNTPAIQFIDHVAINVTDLQRSTDWYERVLGFTIFHKWTTTWMIRRGDMRIGLFLRPKAKKIEDIDDTLAITHFAFSTDAKGLQESQERLTKLGIKFDPPEDTGVAHSLFIYDPDGYQVEITSYYK